METTTSAGVMNVTDAVNQGRTGKEVMEVGLYNYLYCVGVGVGVMSVTDAVNPGRTGKVVMEVRHDLLIVISLSVRLESPFLCRL